MRNPLSSFRPLRSETLEDRRLLATDLAQIAGVVTNDLTGDGASTAAGAGVGVELFLDDGDGTFDPSTNGGLTGDASQGTTTTDASGAYSFDGLTAGNYFVQITPPAGQRAVGSDVSSLIEITAAEAMGTTNLTIDEFGTAQTASATSSGSATGDSADGANPDDGGVRDLQVAITAGAGMIDLTSDFVGTGLLNLASTGNVNGIARVVWDGADGDATSLNPNGLSLDLTGGGANSALVLRAAADRMDAELTIRLYSDAANISEATVTILDDDAGIDGDASEDISVPFTAFSMGADLTNIGAIEVVIDFSDTTSGLSSLDAQIDVVGVVGFTTETQDFTIENEMSLGDRVFLDLDNDGLFEAGESGIPNVALTLFEDTDGDGDFLDEVARDVATTNSQGLYGFTELSPGDYVVRVDDANFNTGGALEGLTTSLGGAAAPDPDNDTDNDDNGAEQTGLGIASLPVTLVGDDEPTGDGDGDDSNLTVDFGFFGFDLVIDKEVDQAVAAPEDTLLYTITVTNNGPTNATGVELSDTLPDDVTFVSGTTDIAGQTVVGTPGSSAVSSTIGTLAPGVSAIITITATIDPDATNTLTNVTSVAAVDESNLTNNTASAVTTVQPEIDVQIVKTDDDGGQTLSPGDSIRYELDVTNNGPSTATNVTVVDTLPTGLTFNPTGSTTPDSTASVAGGTQLTYNLGSLDDDESTEVVINATIDSTFTGTLTNTAVVSADQTETNPNNNTSSAQSVVDIEPASISGFVYVDADDDGVFDPGEIPIANVPVTLTGTDFNGAMVFQTAFTNSAGAYSFTNLNPGTYTVTETQPAFFTDGQDSATFPGATEGEDQISTIVLGPGDNAPANNFGELGPALTKRRFLASNLGAMNVT